jgi:hypothetical protein
LLFLKNQRSSRRVLKKLENCDVEADGSERRKKAEIDAADDCNFIKSVYLLIKLEDRPLRREIEGTKQAS